MKVWQIIKKIDELEKWIGLQEGLVKKVPLDAQPTHHEAIRASYDELERLRRLEVLNA
jgi:hypothetical protein